MKAKRIDRIATGVIYAMVGLVVLILIGLLGFILATGLPHISWRFLTSSAPPLVQEAALGINCLTHFIYWC